MNILVVDHLQNISQNIFLQHPWKQKRTILSTIDVFDHLQNICPNVFYNIHENKRKQLFQQQMFLTTCRISATIFLSGEAPPCQRSQWKKQANLKHLKLRANNCVQLWVFLIMSLAKEHLKVKMNQWYDLQINGNLTCVAAPAVATSQVRRRETPLCSKTAFACT